MKYALSLFLAVVISDLSAQTPDFSWQKIMWNYSGQGNVINETEDGGYIIFGTKWDEALNGEYLLFKVDSELNLVWQKTYGGSLYEEATNMISTPDGGFLLAGHSDSADGDISNNLGNRDLWLVKTDAQGNLEWEKNYGGSNSEVYGKIFLAENGYLLISSSDSSDGNVGGNNGSGDFWIVKISENGDIEWENHFGGSEYEVPVSALATPSQEYIIAGYSNSTDGDIADPRGNFDFWIVKVNSSGELIWEKSLGGSNVDKPMGIIRDHEDGYLVFGNSNSWNGDITAPLGQNDGWVVKLNDEGNVVWDKSFGGSGSDGIIDFKLSQNNGYIFSGVYQPENQIMQCTVEETDSDGNEVWKMLFGTAGWWGVDYYLREIKYSEDGDLLAVGDFASDHYSYFWLGKINLEMMSTVENTTSTVSIYPNPVKDFLYLNSHETIEKIEIYNSAGKLVLQREIHSEKNPKIDMRHFASGVYYIMITTRNQTHALSFLI